MNFNLLILLFITTYLSMTLCFKSYKINKYYSFIAKQLTTSSTLRKMSTGNELNLDNIKISETERKELWKNISNLEREAIQLLSQSDKNVDEAYKLFIKSISLKSKDPFIRLSSLYSEALEEKNSEKLETIFSNMKEIGAPPHITSMLAQIKSQQQLKPLDESNLIIAPEEVDTGSTFSDTVTEKIRVKVNSFYDKEKSDPSNGKYMFWYKVSVCNEGVEPVQIVARMWEIEKCRGEKEVVRGAGVMSTQPIVAPGECFSYTSACPLKVFPPKGKRVIGSMSGAYTLCKGNMGQHNFTVKISKFNLILPSEIVETTEET